MLWFSHFSLNRWSIFAHWSVYRKNYSKLSLCYLLLPNDGFIDYWVSGYLVFFITGPVSLHLSLSLSQFVCACVWVCACAYVCIYRWFKKTVKEISVNSCRWFDSYLAMRSEGSAIFLGQYKLIHWSLHFSLYFLAFVVSVWGIVGSNSYRVMLSAWINFNFG